MGCPSSNSVCFAARFFSQSAAAFLILALLTGPWLFGGVHAHVQAWLSAGLLAALSLSSLAWVCARISGLRTSIASWKTPAVVLVPTLLIAIAALQLIPASATVRASVQHGAIGDLNHMITAADSGKGGQADKRPLSLCPAATRLQIAVWVGATIACLLGAWLFAGPRARFLLLSALALGGVALACFGIVQRLAGSELIYGSIPTGNSKDGFFASYVNRNNAAGYLNLCLGCAIGLCLYTWRESSRGVAHSLESVPQRVAEALSSLNAPRVATALAVVLIATGIIATFSRGGMIAMGAAGGAVFVLARRATWKASVVVGMIVLLGGSIWLIDFSGLSEQVGRRVSAMTPGEILQDGRWNHWRQSIRMVPDVWLSGTGAGTYRYAYYPYQTEPSQSWFIYPENEPLQWLVEGGVTSLLIVLAGVALVVRSIGRLANSSHAADTALATAAAFILASQFVHAFVDFGLEIPANLLGLAAVMGCVGAAADRLQMDARHTWNWTPAVASLALFVLGGMGMGEQRLAAAANAAQPQEFPSEPGELDPAWIEGTLENLRTAVQRRPDDAEAHRALARVLILRFRREAFLEMYANRPVQGRRALAQLWEATHPAVLSSQIRELRAHGDDALAAALLAQPSVARNLPEAADQLAAALDACPVLPRCDLWLSELAALDRRFDLYEHLSRALLLAPADPDLLYRAGHLAWATGHQDLAFQCWRQSLAAEPLHVEEILSTVSSLADAESIANKLLPPSLPLLLDLAQHPDHENSELQRLLVHRASSLNETLRDLVPRGYWYLNQATIYRLMGQHSLTTDCYRQAIAAAPHDVNSRMQFAEYLYAQGDYEAARHHASLCQALRPNNVPMDDLLRNIIRESVLPK